MEDNDTNREVQSQENRCVSRISIRKCILFLILSTLAAISMINAGEISFGELVKKLSGPISVDLHSNHIVVAQDTYKKGDSFTIDLGQLVQKYECIDLVRQNNLTISKWKVYYKASADTGILPLEGAHNYEFSYDESDKYRTLIYLFPEIDTYSEICFSIAGKHFDGYKISRIIKGRYEEYIISSSIPVFTRSVFSCIIENGRIGHVRTIGFSFSGQSVEKNAFEEIQK